MLVPVVQPAAPQGTNAIEPFLTIGQLVASIVLGIGGPAFLQAEAQLRCQERFRQQLRSYRNQMVLPRTVEAESCQPAPVIDEHIASRRSALSRSSNQVFKLQMVGDATKSQGLTGIRTNLSTTFHNIHA